ncbi:helix-turn-helix domain-containing protein [Pelagibacterium limicola]|uniref:helix-turn-helix domain-containing protein n=1 Tax=Pelagibacterium limicola TaxID=2791022 RepID=UPI0018AFE94D|nr:helix-turn-helix domain-containing protein [Pelagibacterium limicola]
MANEDEPTSRQEISPVPSSVLDTRGLAPKLAVAAWNEGIGVIFDTRLKIDADERFFARVESFQIGDLVLSSASTVAQSFDRSNFRIGRDGLDHFMIEFYTEGHLGERDGGTDSYTRPGDLWVSDLTQPQATGTTDCHTLNIIIPRRLLAPLLTRQDDHNTRIIRRENPMVGLFYNHLVGLFAAAPQMRPDQAAALVHPTVAIAAAVLNGAVEEDVMDGVNFSLFEAIASHVRDHLTDPGLAAEPVARRFGISLRKLYYLFERHGGFASYVQRQRLRACRQILADPAQQGLKIADIAERYGFSYGSNFSYAFRREFGMTARDVRQLALEGQGRLAWKGNSSEWWHWISRMR